MAGFSVSEAAGSGFGLIAKRPLSVLVWGIVYSLIVLVPLGLLAWSVAADIGPIVAQARQAREDGPPPAWVFALLGKILIFIPVLVLVSLVSRAVLSAAVFRAVLEPDNRSFAGLRFGKQELWLMLLELAIGVLAGFFVMAVEISAAIVAGLGYALGGLAPEPWTGWVRALFVLAAVITAVVGGIWVLLRLSLAAPMTFEAKAFRLFESWTVTRGHAGKLLGVALLLMAIGVGVGLVFDVVLLVGFGSTLSIFASLRESPEAAAAQAPALLAALLPAVGVAGVLALVLTGPISAIFLAPWAFIYRALSLDAEPQHPPVF